METGKRLVQGLVIGILMFIAMTVVLANPTESKAAAYAVLHHFGWEGDGIQPYFGGPALSGSTLYGMTQDGGDSGSYGERGTLYKINTDGTGYQILHRFTSGTDGAMPRGSLTLSGATLYGCTEYGGGQNGGTVFKINTHGSGYQVLKRFAMGTGQNCPYAAPVISGSTLYGMLSTAGTGAPFFGAIFAMDLNGGNYRLLHEFAGPPTDGATPYGSLILVGSTLYGMTHNGGEYYYGGSLGYGVIFKINTNGSGYKVLKHFAVYDGRNPTGSLTLVGSRLYGMTRGGGSGGGGVIFYMNLDGGDYRVILNLSDIGETEEPLGSLTLFRGKLYGTTSGGGPAGGTVFRVNPDGSGFENLHVFKSYEGDGGRPMGDVTFAGSRLFGWTYAGGAYDSGVFFSLQPPLLDTGMLELLLLD